METPLQITIRNFPHSAEFERHIRAEVHKLEEFHSRIMSCRVTGEESGKHHSRGRQFHVRIDLRIPGREIVVTHDHDTDAYVALWTAFRAARRQLEEAARIKRDVRRSDESAHEELEEST